MPQVSRFLENVCCTIAVQCAKDAENTRVVQKADLACKVDY